MKPYLFIRLDGSREWIECDGRDTYRVPIPIDLTQFGPHAGTITPPLEYEQFKFIYMGLGSWVRPIYVPADAAEFEILRAIVDGGSACKTPESMY